MGQCIILQGVDLLKHIDVIPNIKGKYEIIVIV